MSFAKMIRLFNTLCDTETERTRIDLDFLTAQANISESYARQIMSGSKAPTEKLKTLVVQAAGLDPRYWELSPSAFGTAIGLTDYQIATILNIEMVGINFRSQLRDRVRYMIFSTLLRGYSFHTITQSRISTNVWFAEMFFK